MFFEKTAKVDRLFPEIGNSDKERYASVSAYQNIKINIQPATAELAAVSDGVYGQTYQAFVAVSGILIGDRITVSGTGEKFMVRGVQNWFYGPIPHLELILFKGDN
jgi:hypothetical protein